MTRRHTFLKVGLVAAATTALALAVTVPVSAHTGLLFTVSSPDGSTSTFASISTANAAVTPIGGALPGASGVEIFGETAYAVLDDGQFVTWDHNTGALLTSVPLTISDEFELDSVYGLDTTTDGTVLAYASVSYLNDEEVVVEEQWVSSIDVATGAITPLVEVTDVNPYLDSIATNPVTGITYSFIDENDGLPQYVTLDLAAGTHSERVELPGIADALGGGYFGGADFDPSGTLWFYYFSVGADASSAVLASTTGEFGAASGAVVSGPIENIDSVNLAYDPYVAAAPALANTGVDASALGLGALALFGAGAIALLVVRRRTV